MTNALNPNLPFLEPGALLELASSLDAIHGRTVKAVERLNKDVDARKREIANRWKTAHLDPMQKRAIEAQEVRVAILDIRNNAERELDGLLKEAGAAHHRAKEQRPFYASPVMTLNRSTLGDSKRCAYMEQVSGAGPAELAHLGQFAVSTGNRALAAAIVSRLDSMTAASRPFGAAELAEAMKLDDHRKAVEAIKICDARFQSVVIAIRTWKAEKSNPLHTVSLALQARELDAEVLRELETEDAAR